MAMPTLSRLAIERALAVSGPALLALLLFVASQADAASIKPAAATSVNLEAGKGTLIRLDRPASAVFVADPEISDVQLTSPRLLYLLAKKPGETSVYAVDEAENVLANVEVSVGHNLSRINAAVRTLYPDSDISLSSFEDAVVIEGSVGNATASENVRRMAARVVGEKGEVINRLAVSQPTQVNLRVRVAEISRDVEKQLGINWTVLGRDGFNFAFATVNPFAATGVVVDSLGIGASPGSWDINAIIDALNNERLITVLAEPNLTAMTGQTASFLAGGEFPILVPQGDNQVTVEFKKFGVSLAFTPTVIGNNAINLHVRPEVSDLSERGAIAVPLGNGQVLTVPALTTRRAETTVELGSGQSFAIAGLLSNSTDHNVKKLPLLGDIPVLGRLFASDRFRRNETELVIIVTPYLVRPSPGRLAAPTDGFVPPNDEERLSPSGTWKPNLTEGLPSQVGPEGSRILGPVGFALE
jgi:pilus assembly protein CpaC